MEALRQFKALCFVALFTIGNVNSAISDTFTMATGARPPYVTSDGSGFLNVLANEIFKRAGHKAKVVEIPAKRALIAANQGVYDGDMQRIAGLEKQFPNLVMVPEPINVYEFSGLTTKPSKKKITFADLTEMRVGHLRGWKFYENNLPKGVDIVQADSPRALMKLLQAGRIDIALYSKWSGLYWAKELNIIAYPTKPAFKTINVHMYLHKKHKDIIPQLSIAIANMRKDGTYQKIFQSTLGKTTSAF